MSEVSDTTFSAPPLPANSVGERPRRFRLHWLALLPLGLLVAIAALDQHYLGNAPVLAAMWVILTLLLVCAAAWVLTYLLWSFGGITRPVATFVFCGFVLFACLEMASLCVAARRSAEDRKAAAIINQVVDRANLEYGSVDSGQTPSATVSQGIQRITSELDSRKNAVDDDEREFTQVGGVTLPRLTSIKAIDQRIELAQKSLRANENYVRYFDSLLSQLESATNRPEFAGLGLRDLAQQLRGDYEWDFSRQVRLAEANVFNAEIAVLRFLGRHWGEWTYNKKTNDSEFPNKELQKQIDALEQARHRVFHVRDVIITNEAKRRLKEGLPENRPTTVPE